VLPGVKEHLLAPTPVKKLIVRSGDDVVWDLGPTISKLKSEEARGQKPSKDIVSEVNTDPPADISSAADGFGASSACCKTERLLRILE